MFSGLSANILHLMADEVERIPTVTGGRRGTPNNLLARDADSSSETGRSWKDSKISKKKMSLHQRQTHIKAQRPLPFQTPTPPHPTPPSWLK